MLTNHGGYSGSWPFGFLHTNYVQILLDKAFHKDLMQHRPSGVHPRYNP